MSVDISTHNCSANNRENLEAPKQQQRTNQKVGLCICLRSYLGFVFAEPPRGKTPRSKPANHGHSARRKGGYLGSNTEEKVSAGPEVIRFGPLALIPVGCVRSRKTSIPMRVFSACGSLPVLCDVRVRDGRNQLVLSLHHTSS